MVKLISYIIVLSGLNIRRVGVLSRSPLNDDVKAVVDNTHFSKFYK